MSIAARLGTFAGAVLLALGGGWALGAAVGPVDAPDPARHGPAHPTPTTPPDPGVHDHAGLGMAR